MGELLGKTCLYLDRGLPSPPPFISLRGEERGSTREKEEEENAWQNFVSANSFLSFPRFLGQTSKSAVWQESHVILLLLSPSPFLLLAIQWPWGHARGVAALCDLPPFVRLLLLPSFPLPFLLLVGRGQRRIGGSEETSPSSSSDQTQAGAAAGLKRGGGGEHGGALSIYQRYTEADQEACVPYGGYTRYREILVAPFFSPGPPKLEA